jgi:hypothetical protein
MGKSQNTELLIRFIDSVQPLKAVERSDSENNEKHPNFRLYFTI